MAGLPDSLRYFLSGRGSTANNSIAGMNIEANRLRTFHMWNFAPINTDQLALLGFYFVGPLDLVKCHFCGVEMGMWEGGDDVLTNHMMWSPSCSLIRRRETDNVPLNARLLDESLPRAPPPDVYGMALITRALREDSMYRHQAGSGAVVRGNSTTSQPKHPEYAVEVNRVASYCDWPKAMHQRPPTLSDAGFYYTGTGDKVCCFSCGGELKDWEENDDPWEQHATRFGHCEYVKLVKGPEFIEEMAQRRERSRESTASCRSSPEPKEADPGEDDEKVVPKLCKLCCLAEYNTIFLPCRHVVACAKCASSVTKCPVCRQPFENVWRIYLS